MARFLVIITEGDETNMDKYTRVVFMCFVYIMVQVNAARGGSVEPCPCSVDQQLFIADCSGRDLNCVPECTPNNTRKLLLSSNKFGNISAGSFQRFSELEFLNLDYNQLEYLHNDAFIGLYNLKTLSLSHNQLRHNDSFSDNVFTPLHSILNLYIQGNCNAYPQCTYPDTALSRAPTLSHLFLDGYYNTSLGEGFGALKNLHTLKMDSDVGFCNLGHVPSDMFWNLRNTSVSHIELNHCQMRSLLPDTFSDLSHLETLIVTFNRRLSSDGIINITRGLNSKALKTLRLTDVYHSLENTNLPADMFKDLKYSKLETLDLSGDHILMINPSCISYLPQTLKYFSLSDNIVGDAHFLNELCVFKNLEFFDLSFQNNYKEEKSETQSHDAAGEDTLITSLKTVFSNSTVRENDVVKLPPNIRTVLMNNIKLGYPAPPLMFGPNKLQFLNASRCIIKAFLGPWLGMDHLEILDISYNGMTVIAPTSFYGFKNLTALYMQGNKIGSNIFMDTKCQLFSRQSKLQILDLSDNGFHALPTCLFEALSELRTLLLSMNALTTIMFQMDSLTHLRMLDLSYNELMTMSRQTLSELDRISNTMQLSLDVSGNHFSCGCKQKYFVEWLLATKVIVSNFNNITCVYENKTVVSLAYSKMIKEHLTNECSAWIVTTACAITFVGITLILGFVAIIFHRRGKNKYLSRTGRKTLNPYHKLKNENVTINTDAYISYDQDFEVFGDKTLHQVITENIYPALVGKGLKIKIREELGGNQILSTEISEQLLHCHKVVVFLTEMFCNDYANSHEFHVAATEGLYTNRKLIIPVLVGHSAWDNLLPEMKSYLESEEIVYFPSSEDKLGEFVNFLESRISMW